MTPNELEAYDAMMHDRDRWKARAERLESLFPSGAVPCSPSLNRWEVAKMQQQFHMLQRCPQARAERIAKHYAAHAQLAMEMLKCVEMRQHSPGPQLEELIDHHMRIIVENHRNEFGIELSWGNV